MHRIKIAYNQIILESPLERYYLLIYKLLLSSAEQITDYSVELQLLSWFVFEDHIHEEWTSLDTKITLNTVAC